MSGISGNLERPDISKQLNFSIMYAVKTNKK
jgi:hypothetical protein